MGRDLLDRRFSILVFILVAANGLSAQNFSGGFPFSMPFADSSTQKFIPHFPGEIIGNQNFVGVSGDGYFSRNNKRIRFWGTNLVADGAFPQKALAGAIAGRLRKFGFNLIRMHHLDNPWGQYQIFNQGQSTRTLNMQSLDRLENLIGELKKNGIFINMNLNVSRKFNALDGVLDADSLADMAKGVTLFDPHLIFLQKEYAQQLLTYVNPYTGLALVNDPVMAMLEIVNENSLFRMWYDGKLKPFANGGGLTLRHTKMLDSSWNAFLQLKYVNTTALQNSWNQGSVPTGTINMVQAGDFELATYTSHWSMEQNGGATAVFTRDATNPYQGMAAVKITVTKATSTAWHLQFKQPALTVKKDSVYKVTFAARSDSTRKVLIGAMRNHSPYTYYSGAEIALTQSWKLYSFTFKAPENNTGQTRLTFQFAGGGAYWFDDVTMVTTGITGLMADEALENSSVRRIEFSQCGSYSDNRVKDMTQLYLALQDSFFSGMKSFLKQSLGVKVPISGTNWNIGPNDLCVQDNLDYTDNHAYWDHPTFPNVPWSSTDWYIANQPMVKSQDGGAIAGLLGGVKVQGKPMTVSEYNHSFPNIYQTEGPLFLGAYSAFHDIDGIMLFDYNGGTSWNQDFISSYFDIQRNPSYMSLMPSVAHAFRNGFISPAINKTILQFSKNDIYALPKKSTWDWNGPQLYDKKLSLTGAVQTGSFNASVTTDFSSLPAAATPPYKTDTGELLWNTDGLFTVNTKRFIGFAGFLQSFPNTVLGNLTLVNGSDFATCTWISLTEDSLSVSKTSLFTIATRSQNTGMVWAGSTTLNNNWGAAPTETKPVTLTLRFSVFADSLYIYPLDELGAYNPLKKYVLYPSAPNTFTCSLNQSTDKTLWYGVEKFGNGSGLGNSDGTPRAIRGFKLYANYPNPFNGSTKIVWQQPAAAPVKIGVYSVTGQVVHEMALGVITAGMHEFTWDGKGYGSAALSAGIYFLNLQAGNNSASVKLVYLK